MCIRDRSRDITADNLMTQEAVLIVKDTPEVREMVDGYYPDFTLQCGGICFVQLKETLTQEQFSQTCLLYTSRCV